MKILTGAQMREVDRQAIASGIPSVVLMENAGMRVVEFLARRFAPLSQQRIVVFCGKGNNGGDGLVIARQLHRLAPASLDVVLAGEPATQDAQTNLKHWGALGGAVSTEIPARLHGATLIVDALLGTGIDGAPRGRVGEWIKSINSDFPGAKVVAVDVPSGAGFGGVRAHHTVTFETYKPEHFDQIDDCGETIVAPIGIPGGFVDRPEHRLNATIPADLRERFAPRPRAAHKGLFGHVLVVGGAPGTTGAAAMTGMAALRSGAGLVTVSASTQQGFPPELMTAPLSSEALKGKSVLAIGPGLGQGPESATLVRNLVSQAQVPIVLDADALNVLGDTAVRGCILTPHPGEMSRLTGIATGEIQANRIETARTFAVDRQCTLVLKGSQTAVAFADGQVWLNTTGNPGMATGGAGDILTGLIAGLVAQFPKQSNEAVLAAVWLHGRAGDLGAAELGQNSLIATDLLHYLPRAIHELERH